MMREPVLPAVRAAVFAAVCLGLSVAAHRIMSAAAIPAWAMALGGVGAYAAARAGAHRERGLVGIVVLMGVLQVALHLLFAVAQNASASTTSAAMPGMSMPGMSMPAGASMSMPGMAMTQPEIGLRMGTGMLLAHALAAFVCAWWLCRGEAALHALARSAAHWVVERLAVHVRVAPLPAPAQESRRVRPRVRAPRSYWLLTSVLLRGPPLSPSFT